MSAFYTPGDWAITGDCPYGYGAGNPRLLLEPCLHQCLTKPASHRSISLTQASMLGGISRRAELADGETGDATLSWGELAKGEKGDFFGPNPTANLAGA